MIKKIITNLLEKNITLKDIEYLFELKEQNELEKFYLTSHEIQEKYHGKISYESNIYYPTIYKIEDNCPACGYRTKESRRKYTQEYIIKIVKHKLEDIEKYPIMGINCYNKDISGIRELLIILNVLRKYENMNINVRVSNYKHVKYLRNYNINSIIIQTSLNKLSSLNRKIDEEYYSLEEKHIKFIKEDMHFKLTYEFLINYGESYEDILNKILEVEKYSVDSIEIVGYDPFIDCPEEYNPQYSKDYILKVITLLRIIFPKKEIKIQYATNDNNYLEDYKKIGINTLTGIYTKNLNSKLENTEIIH